MMDHLIRCATQTEADALLEQFGPSISYDARAILQDAMWDYSDPDNPVIVSPEVTASGFHVWVSLPDVSEELRDLPGNACRLIGDRSKRADAGYFIEDAVIYHAADITPEVLHSARISPVPAGSDYPWRLPR